MLKGYEGALEDLDKAHVFHANSPFTLTTRGDVKGALKDYEGALEDFDKVDVFDPNNAFNLIICGDVKKVLKDLKEPWKTLTKLMFLTQTMHSLWQLMEM